MQFSLDDIFDSKSTDIFLAEITRMNEISFNQNFVLKDLGISTRVMNHWDVKGLVPTSSRNKGNKYTFSFIELIWFNIIKELREYGYPLENIKEVFNALMNPVDYSEYLRTLSKVEKENIAQRIENVPMNNEDEKGKLIDFIKEKLEKSNELVDPFNTNPLCILIYEFLMYRKDIRILIDKKGNFLPYSEEVIIHEGYDKFIANAEFDHESFINISLLKFFRKFIMNKKHFRFLQDSNILNENEAHILSLIREGKAKTITIKFKDQKPYMLETTKEKKIEAETRLTEILLSRGYQDISIRTENGNISYSNITTKKILKKI